jgi:peptidoglycan/LPS O-acetylase OafA/YrhL
VAVTDERAAKAVKARVHWPALDGMRAFAVGAVLATHFSFPHFFSGGYLGVDVFFVLSGFLITSLLLGEWGARATVSLRDFYARRALRLFPALAAVIILCSIAVLTVARLRLYRHATLHGLPWVIFYVGNWRDVLSGDPMGLGMLSHTWSLAVEEQFYILWPACFLLILKWGKNKRHMGLGLLAVAVVAMAYRAGMAAAGWPSSRIASGFDTHSDGLLVGCGLAFLLAAGSGREWRRHRSAMAAAVLLVALAEVAGSTAYWEALSYSAAVVLSGVILWDQVTVPGSVLRSVLTWRPVVWVGRRSYGLYLWHFPIYLVFGTITLYSAHPGIARALVEVPVSVAVTALSYRFLERPFLRLKVRFQQKEALPATAVRATAAG